MTKKVLVGLMISVCVVAAHAELPGYAAELAREHTIDTGTVGKEPGGHAYSDELQWMQQGRRSGVAKASVGDPDSFGRSKTYLGMALTRTVALEADCSTMPPGSPDLCIETKPAPDRTEVDEADLAVIELPGSATSSLLCFTITPYSLWEWQNDTGKAQTASMWLRPSIRIESKVLSDPALINPDTGLPFNGVLFDSSFSTFIQQRTLQPGEYDFQYHATTRACTGGLLNARVLSTEYGLSDAVIRDFFNYPITVSFGVRGHVSMVEYASYTVGIRLYGD